MCTANPTIAAGEILTATQKLLDRVLFCAFCEDRGLLPPETIANAYRHTDPYNLRPIWDNFRGLFRSIDQGNAHLEDPAVQWRDLFETDPLLERLEVPDAVCQGFAKLAAYDYHPARPATDDSGESHRGKVIDVDILGHIFEQSITDLEQLRNRLDGRELEKRAKAMSRRKKGAFYTPAFITRYIVGEALGRVIVDRFAALRVRHEGRAAASAPSALLDPNIYDLAALKKPQRTALVRFWEDWQEDLKTIRVLDPACGSGAFLFVVTNKWMKAGYGETLRKFFAENAWMESVVDFGHAKQIFEDADVFPSIVVMRKPADGPRPSMVRVCTIPREQLRIDNLAEQVSAEGFEIRREGLQDDPWSLEPPAVSALLQKLSRVGMPLKEYARARPLLGIKTGLNEAFLIDTPAKNAPVAADPKCAELLRPYLRGQDIDRWSPDWAGLWMIALKSSNDHAWPWSNAGERAQDVFAKAYPAIYAHLNKFRDALINRQDQGRHWWELRACAYWGSFEKPKMLYQDITWQAQFCIDTAGTLCNNTVYFLPTDDLWLLVVLNSPIAWWFAWRMAQHGKDEVLRFFTEFMEGFPVPLPTEGQRTDAEDAIRRLVDVSKSQQAARRDLLDWLRVEFGIDKPSQKLSQPFSLDIDGFIAEVKKLRGKGKPLTVAALKALREEHARSVEPTRATLPRHWR